MLLAVLGVFRDGPSLPKALSSLGRTRPVSLLGVTEDARQTGAAWRSTYRWLLAFAAVLMVLGFSGSNRGLAVVGIAVGLGAATVRTLDTARLRRLTQGDEEPARRWARTAVAEVVVGGALAALAVLAVG